jgi:hypothetical protein
LPAINGSAGMLRRNIPQEGLRSGVDLAGEGVRSIPPLAGVGAVPSPYHGTQGKHPCRGPAGASLLYGLPCEQRDVLPSPISRHQVATSPPTVTQPGYRHGGVVPSAHTWTGATGTTTTPDCCGGDDPPPLVELQAARSNMPMAAMMKRPDSTIIVSLGCPGLGCAASMCQKIGSTRPCRATAVFLVLEARTCRLNPMSRPVADISLSHVEMCASRGPSQGCMPDQCHPAFIAIGEPSAEAR